MKNSILPNRRALPQKFLSIIDVSDVNGSNDFSLGIHV